MRHIIQQGLALYQNNNSPVWRAVFKVGGETIRKTTGERDFDKASKVASQMHFDMTYIKEKTNQLETITFGKAYAEAWAKQNANNEKGIYVNTRLTTRDYTARKHILPFFADRMVIDIDTKLVHEWFDWRDANCGKLAGSSIRDLYGTIRWVLNWCIVEGYYQKVDADNIKYPSVTNKQTRRAYYNLEQQKKLVFSLEQYVQRATKAHERMLRKDLQDFCLLMLASGCRPSEMLRVGADAFKEVKVGNQKTYQMTVIHGTKNHPRGNVILLPFAYEIVRKRIARYENKDISLLNNFWPNHQNFKNIFNTFSKWTGLVRDDRGEKFCPYSLRHSYATNMLKQGHVSMHMLAKQMGTSVGMLERHYSHVVPSLVAEKFINMEDVNKIMLPHSSTLHNLIEIVD